MPSDVEYAGAVGGGVPPTTKALLDELIKRAKVERDAAGRTEHGRHFALVVTKLEEAQLWLCAGAVL